MYCFRERDRVISAQEEADRLKTANHELNMDMSACREKEAEMLQFTEQLAAKNVLLQSELNNLTARVRDFAI